LTRLADTHWLKLYNRATDGRLAGLMTLCFQQANDVFYRSTVRCFYKVCRCCPTDGSSRLEGPLLLLYRWTDGISRLEGPSLLFYRWTDGPLKPEGPSLLLYRWTDEPLRLGGHRCCFIDGPMVWYFICYSFDRWSFNDATWLYRWTDGPLRLEGHRCCFTDGPMVWYFICYSFDRWSFNDATWLFVYPWDRWSPEGY